MTPGLCEDGWGQRQRNGGAGHAGRGRTRNTSGCFQEDPPDNECTRILKRERAFVYLK